MSSPLATGDYWDTIEAALTSLPETNRLREPALASFDHLKDRVTNSAHMALVAVARAAEEAAQFSRPTEAQMHALRSALSRVGNQHA